MSKLISGKNILMLGALASAPFVHASQDYVPGEFIIKLKDNASVSALSNAGINVDREIKLSYGSLYVAKADDSQMNTMMNTLNNNPNIEYAEPNFIYRLIKPQTSLSVNSLLFPRTNEDRNYTPADARMGDLWGLDNRGVNPKDGKKGVAGADVNAYKAWEITKGSKAITIAVIDTGIDYNHPDLKDNMWVNEAELNGEAGVDDDGNGYVDDIHGYDFANNDGDPMDDNDHGTHCAGTIAGVHNDIGVAGVMADATLVAVKFLGKNGGTLEGAIKSIDYATKLNVDLMSNSWGGGGFSQALYDSIQRASEAGIIFTAAAGNSRSNNDARPSYPATYDVPNVISVAAHTASDQLARFSSYGRTTVDIAAPGHDVLSSVVGGGYEYFSGTSMATPHVSGVLGLYLAQEGRTDHAELIERMIATSVPVEAYRKKTVSGGRIDAYNMLTDTRPERSGPKPDAWETVQLESVFESAHPYANNDKDSRTFSYEGAKYIRVVVKKHELENRYDFLEIVDGNGASVEKITGSGEGYKSDYVAGDSITVKFSADSSNVKWGFQIEAVEVQY